MKQPREAVLAAVVLTHLGICLVHGFAHARAGVALSQASTLFVFGVILAGPVLGLVVQRVAYPRAGAWIVAATMAGALVFGLWNHFLVHGADHVSQVAAPWGTLFATTAALLAVTETLGTAVGAWRATAARAAS